MLLRREEEESVSEEDFDKDGKTSTGNPDAMSRKVAAALPVFAGGSAAQTESFLVGQEHTATPSGVGDTIEWQSGIAILPEEPGD
jgi:hypothetical protein